MKKVLLNVLALFLLIGVANAQDGKAAYKKANSAFNSYKVSGQDQTKLDEAIENIKIAMEDPTYANDAKALELKGDIYAAASGFDLSQSVLNPEYKPQYGAAGMDAYDAYVKLYEVGEKKWQKKKAMEGITAAAGSVSQYGVVEYDNKNFDEAYNSFKIVLDAHEMAAKEGYDSVLKTEEDVNNQYYITGLAAMQAENMEEAKAYFVKLYEMDYQKPAVYEALYKMNMDNYNKSEKKDEAAKTEAVKYLNAGREKFPDDVSLLFTEINYYLGENKLDELVNKLKTAIDKEPDNVSLYATLGNVYDNLFQRELEAGNTAQAKEYFDMAKSNYNTALEKQPDFSDAIYSLGALYYNQAAAKTREMNDLPMNETKRFNELKGEVDALFEEALPYFKKAEKLNPNDLNTIIALREIYARKNDYETSGEFKKRYETISGGGTVDKSFFEGK